MPVEALVSVEEYLDSVYRPDCDYIDGQVLERNVGEYDHGRLQLSIGSWFFAREKRWGARAVVEVRLRIGDKRFRIPDVMLLDARAPHEPVVITTPLLCIELLSRRDSLNSIWERTQDYFSIGVPACWIIDPLVQRAWIATPDRLVEAKDGILRAGEIEMPLAEVLEPTA